MLIKDLELAQDLSRDQAAAVRGGNNGNASNETIGQMMALTVPVAIMNGSAANTNVGVTGTQDASQCTTQLAGDTFFAGFPFLAVL